MRVWFGIFQKFHWTSGSARPPPVVSLTCLGKLPPPSPLPLLPWMQDLLKPLLHWAPTSATTGLCSGAATSALHSSATTSTRPWSRHLSSAPHHSQPRPSHQMSTHAPSLALHGRHCPKAAVEHEESSSSSSPFNAAPTKTKTLDSHLPPSLCLYRGETWHLSELMACRLLLVKWWHFVLSLYPRKFLLKSCRGFASSLPLEVGKDDKIKLHISSLFWWWRSPVVLSVEMAQVFNVITMHAC
jgi:hypothetical protein